VVDSIEIADGRRRTFVLDTNVLLYDPNSLHVFKQHEVVIPITVIEEVDTFKKELSETGRNARHVSRYLDGLRSRGSLSEGVELDGGGTLRIMLAPEGSLPPGFGKPTNDNIILQTVKELHSDRNGDVVFVTRDTNMRIKADALGILAEDYENAHILDVDEAYRGVAELAVTGSEIDDVYARGWLPWDEEGFHPNQFVIISNESAPNQSAMTRFDAKQGRLKLVGRHKEGVWGIFARNKEQLFALDLLLDDSISLVTIDGVAGTGKTLLAIACGLRKVADEHTHRRLVVSRPIFPLGRDVGYLPGDINEKLNPWMKPIFDNLELLLGSQDSNDRARAPSYQPLLDQGVIEVEPLTYIRGRSMPRQFFVVDEAQNLTPHEVKTVLTRAGEGTKVILTGDPYQIDNPYVDATSNGLTYVVERFKGSSLAGHITLRKGERSELAERAANLL
jgi:PhoH-like ATPase